MKLITNESLVSPCIFKRKADSKWEKGLVFDSGDAGIIDMNGNIPPEEKGIFNWINVSEHTTSDMIKLLSFANVQIDKNKYSKTCVANCNTDKCSKQKGYKCKCMDCEHESDTVCLATKEDTCPLFGCPKYEI